MNHIHIFFFLTKKTFKLYSRAKAQVGYEFIAFKLSIVNRGDWF